MKREIVDGHPFVKGYVYIEEIKCDCECHEPGKAIMHFAPCCQNGIVRRMIPIAHISLPKDVKAILTKFIMANLTELNKELNP